MSYDPCKHLKLEGLPPAGLGRPSLQTPCRHVGPLSVAIPKAMFGGICQLPATWVLAEAFRSEQGWRGTEVLCSGSSVFCRIAPVFLQSNGCCFTRLLVPQRLHGIEPGRTARRYI